MRRPRQKPPSLPLPAQPVLQAYYDALLAVHGPQNWWPGKTRFEVIVGAILTQNTAWTNVQRAITALRREKLLTVKALEGVSLRKLARLIRPSGYFRQKARKLKEFVRYLRLQHDGSLTKMFRTPTAILREQLLAVHGIGPETADSVLLYAGKHAVFVVDAYTRRILERHRLARGTESYDDIRGLFEKSLPANRQLFNEYHALIVHAGKHFCHAKAPFCSTCALRPHLPEIPEDAR
jgi:endonuclease-3 related protein